MRNKLTVTFILISGFLLGACSSQPQYPKNNQVDESSIKLLQIGKVLVMPITGMYISSNDGGSKITQELFKQLKEDGWDASSYSGQNLWSNSGAGSAALKI